MATKQRIKLVEQKEKYTVCDCCGEEIVEHRQGIAHKIIFKGTGICYVEYVQGENEYDCCDKCCHMIMDKYFRKDKKENDQK